MLKLSTAPLSRKQADAYIDSLHRHHKHTQGDKYRLGAIDANGVLHGVVQVGRPVSRHLDDGETLEVTRLCSDGTKNVCSFLYGKAARIAKELGYKRIITYILEDEPGITLKAAGWTCHGTAGGGSWDRPNRPREQGMTTGKKQRWSKLLR